MFGTLRYSALENETEFRGRPCDPVLGPKDGVRYVACDRCRSKKLRCSGQMGGCDRCRNCSSACVYSLDGKAKNAQQRKKTKSSNNSSSTSEPGETYSEGQQVSKIGQNSTPKARIQEARSTSASKQARLPEGIMQDMTNPFSAGDASAGGFGDDSIFTEDLLSGFLPGSRGQSVHECLNPLDTPFQTGVDQEFLDEVFDLDHIGAAYPDPAPSDTSMADAPTGTTRGQEAFNFPTPQPIQQRRQANKDSYTPQAINPLKTTHYQCRCLETVGVLLDGLKGKDHTREPTTLDSILTSQKEALARCDSVLNCPTCVARPEYIMFLELITEDLTSLYELAVSKYMNKTPPPSRDRHTSRQAQDSRSPSSSTTAANSGKLFVGKYEIESAEEWSGLIRVLMGLQLRNLWTLLQRMTAAAITPGVGVTKPRAKVQATEERVAKLVTQLGQAKSRGANTMRIGGTMGFRNDS